MIGAFSYNFNFGIIVHGIFFCKKLCANFLWYAYHGNNRIIQTQTALLNYVINQNQLAYCLFFCLLDIIFCKKKFSHLFWPPFFMILNHYNNLIFASPSLVEVKSSIKELFSPKLLDGLKGLSLRPWKRRSLWWKTLGLKIQKYCKKGPDIVILLLPCVYDFWLFGLLEISKRNWV